MYEQSKAAKRRYRDGDFLTRYFIGAGIDVGAGPDSLQRYRHLFPAVRSVRDWDLVDGDAQLLSSVPPDSFDFLHSSHCLEHMRDPVEALSNWIRVVKPEGYLVITVPDEDMYEQGVFPSRFNPDHKWTFSIYKGKSWSEKSVNVLDLVMKMVTQVEVERIYLVREFFDDNLRGQDQTLLPNAECAIEFILRKRLPQQTQRHFLAQAKTTPTPVVDVVSKVGHYDSSIGREALSLLEGGHRNAAETKALEALLKDAADCLAMDVLERLYLDSARYADCATILERLLEYTPDNPGAWNNLGCCYGELRDYPRALTAFERAVQVNPAYLTAYGGLAAMRYAAGDAAGAEAAYREVLARAPDNNDARVNIVNCLIAQERIEEARQMLDSASKTLLPDLEKPHHIALAASSQGLDKPYRSRIEGRPIFESMHARLGMALLALGKIKDGLRLLEWRLASAFIPGFDTRRAERMWRGESLRGKSLLLLWEQGYGDVFQGLRHIRRLAGMATRIWLPADDAVRKLFETSFSDLRDKVVICEWRDMAPPFDYYVSLLSLHHRINEMGITQPMAVNAYLAADVEDLSRFRAQRIKEQALAVGLIFAGKADMLLDRQRSLAPEVVQALSAPLRGVRFYSLQIGVRSNDCLTLSSNNGVIDWSVLLDSFSDTAAAMKALDYVVCVDTAAAHLAGALGVPCLLLNRFGSEYRWQLERSDGVWYTSLTQIRQKNLNDWSHVITEVRARLTHMAVGYDAVVPTPVLSPAENGREDVSRRLQDIESALNASRFEDAQSRIDAYLAEYPDSSKAICHAGVLQLLMGNKQAARPLLDRAAELRPDYAVAFSNRAASREENDPEQEQDIIRAITCHPAFHTGWSNLARLRRYRGKPALALRYARRAVQLAPEDADAIMFRAELALDAGEFEESLQQFEKLRDRYPEAPESYANLLPVYAALERRAEAENALEKALTIDAKHAGALNNGVQYFLRSQQYDKALELAKKFVALHPEKASSHVMIGLVYHNLKDYKKAEYALKSALEIEPHHMEALFALGTVFERIDLLDESEKVLEQALAMRRDYRSLVNLAVTLNRQQRYDEAKQLNIEALALGGEKIKKELTPRMKLLRTTFASQPFRAELQTIDVGFGPDWNNALIALVKGEYQQGFAAYELRQEQQTVAGMSAEEYRSLLWHNQSLAGKRILLLPEQGYGDVIHFLRYVPEIKRRRATIIVGASSPLRRLLEIAPGVDEVVSLDDARRPAFDYLCPLMSLANRLEIANATDYRPIFPYLKVPDEARTTWRTRCAEITHKKIGIVWAGRKIYPADRLRSVPLAEIYAALGHYSGIQWVSLQIGDNADEIVTWPGMFDMHAELVDFAETAALIEQLDLIITVDTAVAHLSGALGKPVWMLNRVSTDWRWGKDGTTCAWYPSMRIFRQKHQLNWREPLSEVATALAQWLSH